MHMSVIRSFTVLKYYRRRSEQERMRRGGGRKEMEDSLSANGRYRTEITIDFSFLYKSALVNK